MNVISIASTLYVLYTSIIEYGILLAVVLLVCRFVVGYIFNVVIDRLSTYIAVCISNMEKKHNIDIEKLHR